jgi:NADH-quinone oxidoreductase subunit C
VSTGPAESSIRYLDGPPEAAPPEAVEALAPFGPRWSEHHGDVAVLLPRDRWLDAHRALKAAGWDFFVDHTAVDYPARAPRFTVVTVLLRRAPWSTLLVKARVADGEPIASLTPLWTAANWAERETYDMFGIPFEGHPDLTRIYMPEDYDGWPLRRDFPMQGHLRFRD